MAARRDIFRWPAFIVKLSLRKLLKQNVVRTRVRGLWSALAKKGAKPAKRPRVGSKTSATRSEQRWFSCEALR
jgi:hypothetical protein